MTYASRTLRRLRRAPGTLAILLSGAAFTLLLQPLVEPLAFPHGDAGALKFLAVRQFAAGNLHLALDLPAPAWVRQLWRDGFYPFSPPAVVRVGDAFVSHYPPVFALLSAPFYRLCGARGLLLLPLVSTWALWLSVWAAARSLRLRTAGVNATLAALVFASPVTLYSAFFWEHTPALALAFAGLGGLMLRPLGRSPSARTAACCGVLVGLSAFLREELLLYGGLLLGLACLPGALRRASPAAHRARLSFGLGLLGAWLAFLVTNLYAYGHPLGLHAEHLALETGLARTFGHARPDLVRPQLVGARDFLEHFPIVLASLLVFLPGLGASSARTRTRLLVLLAAAYWLLLHWVVPSEGGKWGPRLTLVLVPLGCLALGMVVDALWRRPARSARVVLLGLAALGLVGADRNARADVLRLAAVYGERAELLAAILADPGEVIAYSHPTVGYQLAGAFAHKHFFLAGSARDLPNLGVRLFGRGIPKFLFLCDPGYPCGLLGEGVERRVWIDERIGLRLDFTLRGRIGRYLAYDTQARPAPPGHRSNPDPAGGDTR